MKSLKITIIYVLLVLFNTHLNAKNIDDSLRIDTKSTQKESNTITYEVKPDPLFLKTKVLNTECKDSIIIIEIDKKTQSVYISFDSIKLITDKLKNSLKDKGFSLIKPEDSSTNEEIEIEADSRILIQNNKNIDDFLNLEDDTIFTSNYLKTINIDQIPKRSKRFYLFLKTIQDLGEYLANVERTLSNDTIEKILNNNSLLKTQKVKDAVIQGLKESAKKDFDKADNILSDLNNYDVIIDQLYPQQKQYYNSLIDRFNKLYELLNPNTQ